MASLRDAVKNSEYELRDGIPWIVFWREGRSWGSEAVFFSMDYPDDTIDPDDLTRLKEIQAKDPGAVALNSYYCGRLGEDMTIDELTRGVRWHYENGFNLLENFIAEYAPMPPELIEEAREKAHAAGLPFSERPYRGQDAFFNPYVYDGSMTPEDYELMQKNIEQERSENMKNDPLSIRISNSAEYENGERGVWLQLPAKAEQLQAAMRQVGITTDNPQDFYIEDFESVIDSVTRLSNENVRAAGVDELNYLAVRLQALDPMEIQKLNAAAEVMSYWDDVHHLTEYASNPEFFVLMPDVFNHIQLGEHYLNSEIIQMPEEWIGAINIEMLGELAAAHEKGQFTEHGYIVESGDEWQPVTEIPQEYRIMSYPQPELTAEVAAALAGERDRALRDIGEEQLEPSTHFDIGGEYDGDPPIDYDAISTRQPAVATVQPPEQAQPQPVIPLVLNAESPAEKLKEITDRLENGIQDIFNSAQYERYLKTLSKFHNYSLNNTILIAMQKPDATHIAGYTAWKNDFGRQVNKGEKGIKILAPSPFKVKKEMEKIDPQTQRPVIGADGKPVTEEKEITIPAFKVVSVFDVSQTEGKELPTIGVDVLTGSVERYNDFFAALEKASPVPIAFENIEGNANGYYHLEDKRIAVKEGMSELQTLKTTIHEIAHARLHDIDANSKDEQPRADRRTREVEAESIAYTVCQHYGLDTSDYSFGYVAGWSGGKELTELKASLETIRTAAAELIKEIDGHFAELQQDKEQTAPEQGDSVYNRLPPEQQQALSNEVQATLQFFIDNDLKDHGELTDGTLEAIAVQGYAYRDGQLEKLTEPQPTAEPQPGFEEWSEPANAENAPENPGTPSDDIGAYLPQQDEQPESNVEYARYADVWEKYNEITGYPISIQAFYQEVSDGVITNQLLNSPYVISDIPNYEYKEDSPNYQRAMDLIAEIRDVHHSDIFREPERDEQPTAAEPETAVKYYAINEAAARRAKEANSYSDYKPDSATAEYRQSVDKAAEIAARQKARVDPMYHEKIDSLLDTYARKLAENMNHGYAIESRVPSMLITGGGNFPTRAKEKQNAARDTNMSEWRDIQGLLDKIRSTGMGGISADDPNAVSKLESKLAGLEKAQETMKAVNAYYRSHKTLDGCPDLSQDTINKLKASMSSSWRGEHAKPFEAYALQNNNAEIHRLKARIEGLKKHEVVNYAGWDFNGGKVEANKQDNRLQIFFDGKPDESTRAELKSNGFKWAPSVGAWQRQLNSNAFFACNYIKSIQPLTGEKPTDLQRKARQEAVTPVQQDGQGTQEQQRAEPQQDTYCIYQLKQGDETRDYRFEPLDRLQNRGLAVEPKNYELVYTAPVGADTGSLERIFEKFNIDHPQDFTGHSLSVSDIVTLNRDGSETAHYVDSFGFKEVPEFLQPAKDFDLYAATDRLQKIHDNIMQADPNKIMGEAAFRMGIKRLEKLQGEIPETQPALKMLVEHAAGSADLTMLKERMTSTMQQINPIQTAEMSTEQNYNMIDGIPNNTPSVGELEARAKAGELINLSDLAAAIKADKAAERDDSDKKPSIREQLKSGREQTERSKTAPDKSRDKSPDLEV